MAKKKELGFEDLARMVQGGFSEMSERSKETDRRILKVDQRFVEVDGRFNQTDSALAELSQDVYNLKMQTKDDLSLLKQELAEMRSEMLRISKMEKEDIDAAIQDIIKFKKRQQEFETRLRQLEKSK